VPTPQTMLPFHAIQQDDGWCDDPQHPQYNHHVKLPFAARHEKLWLQENMYDLIVPLGYNDNPAMPGKGSAIFLHVAKPDYAPTEGCVALKQEDLLELLPLLSPDISLNVDK
jgi:L,D-peptidoglycan transpeptidase YkuD (ErfK/YbiS/YcfS/YnhG family)